MPIQFHCSGCQYLLQVPDDAAGKKARCPRCQSVADVPWTSQPEASAATPPSAGAAPAAGDEDEYRLAPPENPPAAPAWSAPSGQQKPVFSDNPYQSPSYSYDEPKFGVNPYGSGEQKPLRPTQIVLDDVFRYGWEIYKQNLGILVGVSAIVLLVNMGRGMVGGVIEAAMEGEDLTPLVVQSFNLITWPILIFVEVGQAIVFLKVARGQRAEFGDMFSGGKYLLRSLGGDFLWNIALFFGLCALIVPGIFVALILWPFYLFIIDRDQGVFESFSSAQQFTEGNKGTMFIVGLANMGIMLAGVLALCVGVFFAYPLVTMFLVVSYLMMTGQFYKRV
jgi:LSD1 subclass zinc finger protein